MRVLITVPWGERLGGAEAMLQTLLDAGSPLGASDPVDLELVFFEQGSWPAQLRREGLRVDVIEAGRLRQPWRLARCVLALARTLRRRRPDLILSWMPKAHLYTAPAAMLAGMRGRLLWWQHEIAAGHWMDRLATALPARAVGCSSQAAADAQARLRPRRPTFVVAPGVAPPAGVTLPAGVTPPAGVTLPAGTAPPVGVAPRAGDASPVGIAPPAGDALPVVGMVGRLQPWKGQDRLLRAQQLLRGRGRELRTLIVGGDAHGLSSDYAASLPGLVEELGLSGVATLTGQVADAGPYIAQMDVLVNASDPEPFGLVLLEAMARGVAVVAVASGGPLEIVKDGRTGVLTRSGEPAALADALEALLCEPERMRELAAAGRQRYLQEYTDTAMRERMLARLRALAAAVTP
ncbi:MAG TPA: glycosyltransferase [Solirubrobacteraceae bacterium]